MSLRVLFVATECAPWSKVGGLADVVGALPKALMAQGVDVRVLIPRIHGMPAGRVLACWRAGALRELDQEDGPPLWLLDTPAFRRRHHLYVDQNGNAHADDSECFAALCRTAVALAAGLPGIDWRPQVIHCHEWQTALVPLLLMQARLPVASVLSIHNLAHQGLFPLAEGARLGLPRWALQSESGEFWGNLSFLKTGLVFADRLTTVSPRYAEEISGPAFGVGLDGVLRGRGAAFTGILNGLDYRYWDPARDPLLPHRYSPSRMAGKQASKQALLQELGWEQEATPLLGMVTRLSGQKGVDHVLAALPELLARGLRLVLLGSGEAALERALQQAADAHPQQFALRLGFDEAFAHRVYAGSDLFLMPSRFEPCGLAQMIALRYGAVPVVAPVGGLADTVVDVDPVTLAAGSATGFWMQHNDAQGVLHACERALALYAEPERWRVLQGQGMRQRFSWATSAGRYRAVYAAALADVEASAAVALPD